MMIMDGSTRMSESEYEEFSRVKITCTVLEVYQAGF